MQPYAAVAPGSGSVAPAAPGEMHADAAVPGALRYQLPAHIAALPSTAPVYTLRYDALSRQTLHAIVDRFPSFRAARPHAEVVGGRTMLAYTHGTERLGVVLSTGEVFYTAGAGAPAPRTEVPPAALIDAHEWLTAHGLYPSGVAAQATQPVPSGAIMRVQFVPSALIPVGAQSSSPSPRAVPPDALTRVNAAIDLSVDLDAAGHVVAAHRLWPRVIDSGRQRLLGVAEAVNAACKGAPPCTPSQATVQGPSKTPGSSPAVGARGSAPTRGSAPSHGGTPTFIVDSVTLVYRVTGSVPNAHLRPSYLLQGHLSGPVGDARTPVRPYTELIAADGR
jgi:hypothetical protein